MSKNAEYSDEKWIKLLQTDSNKAIDLLFRAYYGELCRAVYRIVPNKNVAEDLTQEVFYELWKKKDNLIIKSTVKGYLKRSAINKSLNYVRDQKMKFDDADEGEIELKDSKHSPQQKLEAADLQKVIDKAIDSLPEKCRVIFVLSRFEALSYQEIANSLGISIKTVENQISKALKILRVKLAPYRRE